VQPALDDGIQLAHPQVVLDPLVEHDVRLRHDSKARSVGVDDEIVAYVLVTKTRGELLQAQRCGHAENRRAHHFTNRAHETGRSVEVDRKRIALRPDAEHLVCLGDQDRAHVGEAHPLGSLEERHIWTAFEDFAPDDLADADLRMVDRSKVVRRAEDWRGNGLIHRSSSLQCG